LSIGESDGRLLGGGIQSIEFRVGSGHAHSRLRADAQGRNGGVR
jgi:hypothetical protein